MRVLLGLLACATVISVAVPIWAADRLADSPRHHEWVDVTYGERTVRCFVAYPETTAKTLAVLVIHENKGLTEWVRSFADQVAEAGYLAIAPDLLSGFDAEHAGTDAFASTDAATKALYQLDPDQVTSDLTAVRNYVAKRPSANGKVAVAGFCWGGAQAFRFATHSPAIEATLVFYGSPPDSADLAGIEAPVFGFYGGMDERINATIDATQKRMAALGKRYEPVVYSGVGHAFMRRGDAPDADRLHRAATELAWVRLRKILARL